MKKCILCAIIFILLVSCVNLSLSESITIPQSIMDSFIGIDENKDVVFFDCFTLYDNIESYEKLAKSSGYKDGESNSIGRAMGILFFDAPNAFYPIKTLALITVSDYMDDITFIIRANKSDYKAINDKLNTLLGQSKHVESRTEGIITFSERYMWNARNALIYMYPEGNGNGSLSNMISGKTAFCVKFERKKDVEPIATAKQSNVLSDGKSSDFTFRNNIMFGMSKADVIKDEGKKPDHDTGNQILYLSECAGIDANLIYSFDDDGLWQAGYVFAEEHSNDNLFVEDYEGVQALLVTKYGKPSTEGENWRDDLYKYEPSKKGFAISLGDLTMASFWTYQDYEIKHIMDGDNYDIKHLVIYQLLSKIDANDPKKDIDGI